jgi:hypothetical protein
MNAVCPVCGCGSVDSLLCHADTSALERELGDVAAIVAELDVTLSKQARIGNASGPSGLARERTPVNWSSSDPRWVLGNVLSTWARDVSGETWRPTQTEAMVRGGATKSAARFLLSEVPLIRRHPAVEELVDQITDAVRLARRTVDRPTDRQYLGTCLMENRDDHGHMVTCLEEVWARPGASEVQCKVCGTDHPVVERRAWLLKKAEDMLCTVREASSYMGEVGHIMVTQSAIRGYIHRGKIGYRSGNLIRLGDLLAVVVDEGERRTA